MDRRSRRELMQEWLEVGHREKLPYRELAKRAGVCPRTMMRWQQRLRDDAESRAKPDHDEQAFVKLAECVQSVDSTVPRIEIVAPGERRLIIQGNELIDMLARLVRWHRLC